MGPPLKLWFQTTTPHYARTQKTRNCISVPRFILCLSFLLFASARFVLFDYFFPFLQFCNNRVVSFSVVGIHFCLRYLSFQEVLTVFVGVT